MTHPTAQEVEATLDRARQQHDNFCERIDVDIGVGSMTSPCSCYERFLENALKTALRREQRNEALEEAANIAKVCADPAEIEHRIRALKSSPESANAARQVPEVSDAPANSSTGASPAVVAAESGAQAWVSVPREVLQSLVDVFQVALEHGRVDIREDDSRIYYWDLATKALAAVPKRDNT